MDSNNPTSPLARFVTRAKDPNLNTAEALKYYLRDYTQTVWSYDALYRASIGAARKLSSLIKKSKSKPPTLSPLQTNEKHKAHTIGLLLPEGPHLVICTLAVALAGAAVVPLSENDPAERLAHMMGDSQCAIVVVDDSNVNASYRHELERAVELLDRQSRDKALTTTHPNGDVLILNASDTVDQFETYENQSGTDFEDDDVLAALDLDLDLCHEKHHDRVSHVFFTSGSTGKPKGCIGTRGGLRFFCSGKIESHKIDSQSTVFVASPSVFDPSFGDVFSTLCVGACLAMCPKSLILGNLGRCLAISCATHLTTTPTALGTVVAGPDAGLSSLNSQSFLPHLKVIALGGEQTPQTLVDFWIDKVDVLANTYGVTECCVYQTFSAIKPRVDDSRKYLGQVMGNGLKLIHAKAAGDDPLSAIDDNFEENLEDDDFTSSSCFSELWLCGPQVGLGYAGDPESTAERFRVIVDSHSGNEIRYFRTGDITKRVQNNQKNSVHLLIGRKDGQVKIRGRRVELGEIECVMRDLFAGSKTQARGFIKDVVVTVTGKQSEQSEQCEDEKKMLVAWMRAVDEKKNSEESNPDVSESNDPSDLLSVQTPSATTCDTITWLLKRKLPQHMVPTRFGYVNSFPTTNSGKVDLDKLSKFHQTPAPPNRNDDDSENDEFNTDVLFNSIRSIWSLELGVPTTQVSKSSKFLELGGDSMVAVKVCRRVCLELVYVGSSDEKNKTEVGQHGEALRGALAPVALTADVSLKQWTVRLREDITQGVFGEAAKDDLSREDAKTVNGGNDKKKHTNQDLGVSLLYKAAVEDNHSTVHVLVNNGVPVDGWVGTSEQSSTLNTQTPLHAACAAGAEKATLALVSNFAKINVRARRGVTPLSLALSAPKPFSVEGLNILLQAGDGDYSFLESVFDSKESYHSKKKNTSRKNKSTKKRVTCLFSLDDDKQTVLHAACRSGTSSTNINWLLGMSKQLADGDTDFINWRDQWGRTALHWAALNGHRGVVASLLHNGASISVRDTSNETPTQLAERRAMCSARERPDGERASRWGDIANLLGGSGATKHLTKKR
tara:strand:+ start:15408 stop:18599 length:3192 start_codon:yes stop_codon:yes gene_type:complete